MAPSRSGGERSRRVDEALRQVVAGAVAGLTDPRLRLVTITGARRTPDGMAAHVHYQVHGDEARQEEARAGLEAARGVLQGHINAALHLKHTPILRFHHDDSYARSQRLDALLEQARPDPRLDPAEDA